LSKRKKRQGGTLGKKKVAAGELEERGKWWGGTTVGKRTFRHGEKNDE